MSVHTLLTGIQIDAGVLISRQAYFGVSTVAYSILVTDKRDLWWNIQSSSQNFKVANWNWALLTSLGLGRRQTAQSKCIHQVSGIDVLESQNHNCEDSNNHMPCTRHMQIFWREWASSKSLDSLEIFVETLLFSKRYGNQLQLIPVSGGMYHTLLPQLHCNTRATERKNWFSFFGVKALLPSRNIDEWFVTWVCK